MWHLISATRMNFTSILTFLNLALSSLYPNPLKKTITMAIMYHRTHAQCTKYTHTHCLNTIVRTIIYTCTYALSPRTPVKEPHNGDKGIMIWQWLDSNHTPHDQLSRGLHGPQLNTRGCLCAFSSTVASTHASIHSIRKTPTSYLRIYHAMHNHASAVCT